MDDGPKQFSYGGLSLQYTSHGHGDKLLIAFHGYGQSPGDWKSLIRNLDQDYSVICFALPFHEGSTWQGGWQPITQQVWADFISNFIQNYPDKEIHLIGFSIGSKLALGTLQAVPQKVKSIWLAAPDGLRPDPIYKLATNNPIMRWVLRYIVWRPKLLFGLAETTKKLKIIPKSTYRFVTSQMDTRPKRWRLYHSWMAFRQLSTPPATLVQIANKYGVEIKVLLGRYDKVTRRYHLGGLLKMNGNISLEILPTGHTRFLEAIAVYVNKAKEPALS